VQLGGLVSIGSHLVATDGLDLLQLV
jgi:hypothetical protein